MICPKCGFEQPESPECARCGIIVGRYKGPVFGGAGTAAPVAPPAPPVAAASAVGTVFGDPAPVLAGGGTVYGGPPPAAGGGTVYQGPAPGAQPRPGTGFAPVLTITQKLRFGEVLSESFGVYFKNFIPFSILTAIAFSPIYLFGDYMLRRFSVSESPVIAFGVAMLVLVADLLLCVPLSTAMITYGVFQEMRGRSASLGSCLSVGLSSLLPVISVAFLQAVIAAVVTLGTAFVVSFAVGLLGGLAGARPGSPGSAAACSVMLAPLILLVFLFPLMFLLRYFVAVPAAVEEREGALNAMRRSVFLTEGQRGRILGIMVVLGILNLGVLLATSRIPAAGPLIQALLGLVTSSLFATTCAVIYYRLRSFHESIDVDQIASVFD
jgi:hypothetical protein